MWSLSSIDYISRKALRKSSSEELLRDVGELEQQREAAMKRVLDRQREAQRRTQQEEQLHVEKRMSAILSLKKNIAASEVCKVELTILYTIFGRFRVQCDLSSNRYNWNNL